MELSTSTNQTKLKPGAFVVQIETLCGWSESRTRYGRLRTARQRALWLLSMGGVRRVRVVDLNAADEPHIIIDLQRRKPR